MKRKLIVFILALISLSTFCLVNVKAADSKLFPAVVVTQYGDKWGYMDEAGYYEIKPEYDYVSDFNSKGIAIVSKTGKYSYEIGTVLFIDRTGKTVLGPFTSYVPEFKEGIAIVRREGLSDLVVDETGKIILESKYELYKYSEGLINFYQVSSNNKSVYGYMDLKGKIVIPAKYQYGQEFKNGRAVVKKEDGSYSIIDKTGKVLGSTERPYDYAFSEGMANYYDEKSDKYGYKLQDGTVAILPKFSRTSEFQDGYAVVGIDTEEYVTKYGLINKKGDYVIKPEYSGIEYLGHNLYAVSQTSYLPNSDNYAPKAIFNNKGEKLSDFKYHNLNKFEGNYASACDDLTTFFIDLKGNIVNELPMLKGIGRMHILGDMIKAELDGGLTYLDKSGEVIWSKDESVKLENGVKVEKVKYRLDYLTYIEYPEVFGLEDKKILENVNKQLKKVFTDGFETSDQEKEETEDEEFLTDVYSGFSVQSNKNLLIIEKAGYYYPIGAAHGQPSQDYFYVDLRTGTFYELKDLFKSGSKYTEKLEEIVNRQLQLNSRIGEITGDIGYFEDKAEISEKQNFIIGKDSIKIYYYPYEIAAYAVGFPEFEIPYGQIIDMIDTKGAFWNSFDKKVINHKINVYYNDIDDNLLKSIEDLLDSYENKLMDAINSNSFTKVEVCLLKGSNLYNSQKKLVQSLNKQKTKEKLNKYEVYAVSYDSSKKEYKLFVLEDIGIKYYGKSYVNKQFSWYYTVKTDEKGNLKLSNISKW